ncbi:restriction endonuclease subunit S [Streptomyces sp. NPDC017454]|uniref:restriction endonuclease subunit S n=1 Tax=Streptomyces TaxID=1883 RepID=UPI00324CE342
MKFALSANDSGAWGEEPGSDSATPVLRSTEISLDGYIDPNEPAMRKLSSRERGATSLRAGDILVVKSSGSDAHLGKSGWVDERCRGMSFSNFIQRLRVSHDFDPRYTWYFLNSAAMKGQVRLLSSTSTGLQNLSGSLIGEIEIPRPPLGEQQRIADFLDAETTRIDLVRQQRARQRDVLTELELSVIDDVLTQVRESPMVRLGYLAFVQTGVTVDSGRQHDDEAVTRPYLRVANVQVGYVDLNEISEITVSRRAAAASRLQVGDVLMTEGGDLDKLGRGTVWLGEIDDCLHQNHVFAVRPDANILTPEYLALLTRAPMGRKYFESTGNKTTNLASTSSSKIRDLRIPLTDPNTQREMVKEVNTRLDSISDFEELISKQLRLLVERRQALITAAVTGQFDVTTASGRSLPRGTA